MLWRSTAIPASDPSCRLLGATGQGRLATLLELRQPLRFGNDKTATKTDSRRIPCQRSFRVELAPCMCRPQAERKAQPSPWRWVSSRIRKGVSYATRIRDSQRDIHSVNHDCADVHAQASCWAPLCFSHMFRYLRHCKATGNKQGASRTFTIRVSERGLPGYREFNKYNFGLTIGRCGLVAIKRSRSKHDLFTLSATELIFHDILGTASG
jgi:hypothetical protein